MTDSSTRTMSILCVVPTHGRNDLLPRALASIEHQSLQPTRVRVVDDLEDDGARALVEKWSRLQQFEVEYVPFAPLQPSAGASRNEGARMAREDLVAFLDDDDAWAPTFLELSVERLTATNAALAIAWTSHVLGPDRERGLRIQPGLRIRDVLAENPGITGSNFVIRRDSFACVGGFDTQLFVSNDLDFFVRLLQSGADYCVVGKELVDQIAHDRGQLTTPSERRAAGLQTYLERYEESMSSSQRREMRRSIYAVRRQIAQKRSQQARYTILQALNSSPRKLSQSVARAVTGKRSIYTRNESGLDLTTIVHIGVVGDAPGGMAQVINRYLGWAFDGFRIRAIATTRRARDPLAALLSITAVWRVLLMRLRGNAVCVVHLSERGSFVREGGVLVFARWIGLPTVAHLHGAEFVSFAARHPALCRYVLMHAHHIAALTTETHACVVRLIDARTPTTLVPNGVDVPETPVDKEGKLILFAGEVGPRKGADLLAEAWRRVASDYPTWNLAVAGPDGGSALMFEGLQRAEYLGSVSHAEVDGLLDKSRIAVLPSRNEALPMFVLEAMARGCAVVATDVGEIKTVVGERNGVLVDSPDVNELEGALRSILMLSIDELSAKGIKGHEIAKARYSEGAVKDALADVWRRALDDSRGPRGATQT